METVNLLIKSPNKKTMELLLPANVWILQTVEQADRITVMGTVDA